MALQNKIITKSNAIVTANDLISTGCTTNFCVSCTSTQPSAVISGASGDVNYNGTYTFLIFYSYGPGNGCEWIWQKGILRISVVWDTWGWEPSVSDSTSTSVCEWGAETRNVPSTFSCVSGVLTGTVIVPLTFLSTNPPCSTSVILTVG
jgi:hypothetical protein